MRLIIKHKGGEQIGRIPEAWSELSVKQFLSLEAGLTDLPLLSVLSGIDLEYIENTDADLTPALNRIYQIYNEKPPELEKLPKRPIKIDGKTIKMPDNINNILFGQKSIVQNLLKDNPENVAPIISRVFAVFAQPVLDGVFRSSRLDAVTKQIDNLKIIDVFPYVLFFFKKLRHWRIIFQMR